MSAQETLTSQLEPRLIDPLSALGLDLEAIEITPAGKRRVLRIAVDKDGGVTMDDVATATRAVSDVLDESDLMGATPYTLEVTSRGVDRPLTLSRHWRRNADRLVKVTLLDGSCFTGRIGEAGAETVAVEVSGEQRVVEFADVERALVQIEFNRKDIAVAQPDEPDEPDELDETADNEDSTGEDD